MAWNTGILFKKKSMHSIPFWHLSKSDKGIVTGTLSLMSWGVGMWSALSELVQMGCRASEIAPHLPL